MKGERWRKLTNEKERSESGSSADEEQGGADGNRSVGHGRMQESLAKKSAENDVRKMVSVSSIASTHGPFIGSRIWRSTQRVQF